MSRALTSLPIVKPTSSSAGLKNQRQLGLGNAPARVAPDADRLARADDPAGSRLEEQLGPTRRVDQVVERGRLVGFLLARDLASLVSDARTPDFLASRGAQHANGRIGKRRLALASQAANFRRGVDPRARAPSSDRFTATDGDHGSPWTTPTCGVRSSSDRELHDLHRVAPLIRRHG